MNILFMNSVAKDSWGGGEKWMLTTASGLRKRQHQIHFCGRTNSLFLKRGAENQFQTLPLDIKGDFSLPTIIKLAGYYKEHTIAAVIANFNKDVRLGGLAGKISGHPLLVARNGLPILHDNLRYRLTYRWLVNGIITNTSVIKNQYLSYGWLNNDFIRVVPNGIDVHIPGNFDREETAQKYDLPLGCPVIGIFGRLVKQKQHAIFLEVAKNILEQWPDTIFVIVGEGPLREQIQKYAFELGILDNVYLLGLQEKVMELYAFCDIILLTSEDEGLPNVVMESMLAGKPVVAFNVGGVKDLIQSDKTGIAVPPNDIYLMTQKINELLLSPTTREAIGREAQKYITENFSVGKMIDRVEEYLLSLQKQHSTNGQHQTGNS